MEIYHTSPVEINEIRKDGLFNDCLFFSSEIYQMSGISNNVYAININKIIEVSALDDTNIVNEISEYLNCTNDQAQEMLNNELEAGEITGEYQDGWYIQAQQGQAAKNMGYEACESVDEQGTVYIVPMLNKLNELNEV